MGIEDVLEAFAVEKKFKGRKGPLSVALVVTQHGKSMGLPLNPEALVTDGGGQVLGLGCRAVQAVLKRHGLTRVLASEGGRTSRGSLNNMREYVRFLNGLAQEGKADLDAVEQFWVGLVREYFASKPFRIRLDNSRSLRTLVRDVVAQAEARQKTSPGMHSRSSAALPRLRRACPTLSSLSSPVFTARLHSRRSLWFISPPTRRGL